MNILAELKARFAAALTGWVDEPDTWADQIKTTTDASRGDYQANMAMPLKGRLNRPPQEIAREIVDRLQVEDLCSSVEIAGPGFINLKLRDEWLTEQAARAARDERLAVEPIANPRRYVIDYSAPNVAKPMHVGHIRSTAIGNAIAQILNFLGHEVITDNHIGDWGTQFGMIIYGYRNFLDEAAYAQEPVAELARLYRLVRQLADYHDAVRKLPQMREEAKRLEAEIAKLEANPPQEKNAAKKHRAEVNNLRKKYKDLAVDQRNEEDELVPCEITSTAKKIEAVESSPQLRKYATDHPDIYQQCLIETAKLHAGDEANLALWHEFVPICLEELDRTYERLGVSFDHSLGESFYHDRLEKVVQDFQSRGLAKDSDGAVCVFLEGSDVPMIIQKSDGAFLYSTTDLATIQYRVETWNPDAILYVVDFRQGEHFEKLFAATRLWGITDCELTHVKFGTVNDKHGKPFKTRGGGTVGLDGLLDEAVATAAAVVETKDNLNPEDARLSAEERAQVAEMVGIGAIFYNDLSHNRESDYVFDYAEMVKLDGNTAAYMQYAYARACGIFRKGGTSLNEVIAGQGRIMAETPEERALIVQLLRFHETLAATTVDYRPNLLTNYLWDMCRELSRFFETCPVLKSEGETRTSRLLLCALAARTIEVALRLLGIRVRERM